MPPKKKVEAPAPRKSTRATKTTEKNSLKSTIELKVESPKASPVKRKREVTSNKENKGSNKENAGNKKLKSTHVSSQKGFAESFNFHELPSGRQVPSKSLYKAKTSSEKIKNSKTERNEEYEEDENRVFKRPVTNTPSRKLAVHTPIRSNIKFSYSPLEKAQNKKASLVNDPSFSPAFYKNICAPMIQAYQSDDLTTIVDSVLKQY